MSYKVSRNGLWGDKVKPPYPGITKEIIEETVQRVFGDQPERQWTFHTGIVGREQFHQAIQESNANEQLWTDLRNERYVAGVDSYEESPTTSVRMEILDFSTEPPNVQRMGSMQERDINYLRLQRGEITTLEYLDLISEEE